MAWFKTAIDPFHDYDVGINGIPDMDGQASVVQIMPKVRSVTAPAGLAPGETWSCHITTLPLAETIGVISYLANGNTALANAVAAGTDDGQVGVLGTYTIVTHGDAPTTSTSNSSFPASAISYSDPSRQFEAVSIDDVGQSGMKKLIAGGFEVHNDTAELYKQGSVTVYQNSQDCAEFGSTVWRHLTATPMRTNSAMVARQPPATRTAAASLPTSRTWEAAKGCYVPTRLGTDTRYKQATTHQFRTRYLDTVDDDENSGYMQIVPSGEVDVSEANWNLGHRSADIETTGAYFSGLSPETVLTATFKLIIESAPTPANPSLLFSATPTPDYDPRIIALYNQTIRHLPPGVPVSFNAKGDWYRMAVQAANAVAPVLIPVATTINPGVGVAIETALAGMNIADRVVAANQKKKNKPKNKITPGLIQSLRPPATKAVSKPNR